MKYLITCCLVALTLMSCKSKTEIWSERSKINEILGDHNYPDLPLAADEHEVVITLHKDYDEYDIRFTCSDVDFSQFLLKVSGASSCDNEITQTEVIEALRTQPSESVWRDRRSSDEPNYSYVAATRIDNNLFEVIVEFEDIK